MEGSYTCDCSTGYQRSQDSELCEGNEVTLKPNCHRDKFLILWINADLDECLAELNVCSENEACLNTVGSFACPCNTGFIRSYERRVCEGM